MMEQPRHWEWKGSTISRLGEFDIHNLPLGEIQLWSGKLAQGFLQYLAESASFEQMTNPLNDLGCLLHSIKHVLELHKFELSNWEEKAEKNVNKWGVQSIPTLLLAIQEEVGELAEAMNKDDFNEVVDEIDDLGPLVYQLKDVLINGDLPDEEKEMLRTALKIRQVE